MRKNSGLRLGALVFAAACTPVTPSASPTATVPRSPFSTLVPSPRAPALPAQSPASVDMGERERSDRFWGALSHFEHQGVLHYGSLAEITGDSHLIVRGRVTGIQTGQLELFDGSVIGMVFGVVRIDEVLKGAPEAKTPGTILVAELAQAGMPEADLPAGEVLLFLKNYAQERIDTGNDQAKDPDDRYYYSRPNSYQSVLRRFDGVVEIVDGPPGWEQALGPFPSRLDGHSFVQTINRIRALDAGLE